MEKIRIKRINHLEFCDRRFGAFFRYPKTMTVAALIGQKVGKLN